MLHDLKGQATRYAATAGIVFVGTLPIAYILLAAGMSIPTAANVLLVPVVVAKFVLYKYWVFRNRIPKWLQQPAFFLLVVGVGWGTFVGIQYAGMTWLGLTEWFAFGMAFLAAGVLRFLFFRRLFAV